VLPSIGVYWTYFDGGIKKRLSMTYIGKRPTVTGNDLRLETNIIDYDDRIKIENGKNYTIHFIKKIRGEKKFHNLEELKKSIYNDRLKILQLEKSGKRHFDS
jgi:riboflavin kinase/FMN adenylyltransferase